MNEDTIDLGAQKQRMMEEFDRLHALIVQQADDIHHLGQTIKDMDLTITNLKDENATLLKQMAKDFVTITNQKRALDALRERYE